MHKFGFDEHARQVALGEIADVITKGTTPTTLGYDFQDEGVNFLKIECFDEAGNYLGNCAHISEECNEKLSRSKLQENDILFSIAGAIGRVAIVSEDLLPANTNQALAIIRISDDEVYLPYIKLILQSGIVRRQFEKQKQGVAQLNLSLKNVGDLIIPLFSKERQKEFVELFSKVQVLIDDRRSQMVELDTLIKARFVEMFGDPIKNPMEWEVKKFEDISSLITDGEHATPRRVEKGIYLLSARNVLNHSIQVNDVDYIDEEEYQRIAKRVIPKEGDVLISCSGSIGRCCVVPKNFKFQMVRSAALIRFNEDINPVFAEWLITSDDLQHQIMKSATQSSQANLFQGKIRQLQGYIPPKDLQDKFADFVTQVDKLKVAVQKSLDELQTLFDSLMQEYFG